MYIQLQNRKEAQQPLNLNSISKEEIAPVETIIKAAGLDGIYQKKILCILIIQFFVGAFFHTGLYYQLLDPSNHCFDNPQIAMASPCKDQAQCFEELQKARVLDKVGYTVSYQFSLVCDRKKYAHYISIFYWLGGLCGTLYYSNVSQKRGRRKALIEAMSLSGLSAIVGSFSFNYFIFMATTFCSAFGYYGSTNAAFILISEQFSQFWRRLSPGLVMAFNCLGSIAMSYWWRYLQEWQFWLMYATGLPLLVSSLLLFFIQQSPRYLVNKGRFKQAMEMIIKIAEKNDRKLIDFQFEEQVREMKVQKKLHETIQSIVGKNRVAVENIPNFGNILTSQNIGNFSSVSDHTFYSLWKYESLKRKTLILLYLWGLFHFTNVITTDTFINSETNQENRPLMEVMITSKAVEILANIIAINLAIQAPRGMVVKFAIIIVFGCIILFFFVKLVGLGEFLMELSLLIIRLTCCGQWSFYCIYTCETFPTSVRHYGLGIIIFWTQFLDIWQIPYEQFLRALSINLLIPFLPLYAIAFVLMYWLEETVDSDLKEKLEEEKEIIQKFLGEIPATTTPQVTGTPKVA